MSLVDDRNKEANAQNVVDARNSNLEHLAELEAKRIENEKYKKPAYSEFWARKRAQVQKLRNRKVLLTYVDQ